jgi:aconitate hydratase
MGAEIGATTSTFAFDDSHGDVPAQPTGRDVAELAKAHADHLRADPEVEENPGAYYDQLIEIDLSNWSPTSSGRSRPTAPRPSPRCAGGREEERLALDGQSASSVPAPTPQLRRHDLGRLHVAKQAKAKNLKAKARSPSRPARS